MNFDKIQAVAVAGVLNPDMEAFHRYICREFSHKFNTPLKEVEEYPPDYVLLHFLEDMYQNAEEEKLDEIVYRIADPDGFRQGEQALDDLIKSLEQNNLKKQSSKLPKSKVVKFTEDEGAIDNAGEGLESLTSPDLNDL